MYMKKIVSVLMAASLLTACSRDKDAVAPASPAVGFWKGTYGINSANSPYVYAVLFRANGTMRIYANQADTALADKAEGNYVMEADQSGFEGSYQYAGSPKTYYFNGLFNAGKTTVNGTWIENGTATTGTYLLSRQ